MRSREDEAAWIAEAVRTGALDSGRVDLAAKFGHAGASAYGKAELRFDYQTDCEGWVSGVIEAAEDVGLDPRVVLVRVALPGAETYFCGTIYDPASPTVEAMYRALLRFVTRPNTVTEGKLPPLADRYLDELVLEIAEEDRETLQGEDLSAGDLVIGIYRMAIGEDLEEQGWRYCWEAEPTQEGIVELITWLLGRGDPAAIRLAGLDGD